jgi:hypothetical protein
MEGRTFARILLIIVLVGAAIGIGVTAYDAGITTGLAQSGHAAVTTGDYPVAPYVGYGWGAGLGFGFFHFFGFLLFLFLIFALLRAAFGGRRHWGGRYDGRGGPGGWGGGDWRGSPWENRAREVHDEWHRGHSTGSQKPPEGGDGPAAS